MSSSSSAVGLATRPGSGAGCCLNGVDEWHPQTGGQCHPHLKSASDGLWWQSCGGATGGLVEDESRSSLTPSLKTPAQGAKACWRKTWWAVA